MSENLKEKFHEYKQFLIDYGFVETRIHPDTKEKQVRITDSGVQLYQLLGFLVEDKHEGARL